jgi:hypothetical protein
VQKRIQSELLSVFCTCTNFIFNSNEQPRFKEARGNQSVKPFVDGELYGNSYCLYEGSYFMALQLNSQHGRHDNKKSVILYIWHSYPCEVCCVSQKDEIIFLYPKYTYGTLSKFTVPKINLKFILFFCHL